MKLISSIGAVVLFITLWQGINWILNSLGVGDSIGNILTFLISIIFASLIVVSFMQIQQSNEIKKIKDKLKMKEEKSFIDKIMKNKKGNLDPRILFWILIAILGYLFLKAIGIIN